MSARESTNGLIGPLWIENLANGGKGIARDNGRVIFVANAFPGDLVLCRVTNAKKNYAEAEVVDLLQLSPQRRIPPCPVAEECGGCQWQQLPYTEQLKWKQQLFSDTLIRKLRIDPQLIRQIAPSPDEFGYRSRVQVKCHLAPDGFVTGFFRPRSRFVVAVDSCPLMPPHLNQLLRRLREPIASSRFVDKIPQIDLATGYDDRSRAVVHYLGTEKAAISEMLLPVAERFDFDLVIQCGRKESLSTVRGSGELKISVDQPDLLLTYAAGGFAQINLLQNRKLVEAVMAAAECKGDEQVLDLYCGMGNFSLPLARRAAQVTGVEDFAPSIEMARRNARANDIANVDFQVCSAEQVLLNSSTKFDLLVLDPPRAGAFAVVKQLLKRPIRRVAYVSCDPQTLARDLQVLLHGGYRLVSSQAFDMFPQTHHVESLTVLEKQL
ncbi:23S rRNA (uracil(1939)-C(5))-methyltransferase RlmD [Malonomonas rubra]|uniref:23S rRNA (uracil(1939)-C(5))-methyltransferase RlmD n=1 Tax=Malonomonas rubra TaxID=57040 RepID=UPI0026EFCE61|nr:23S rRNA (uracil(1939)-C(5))-methyltransferase RlmD [Malonomonas rubra]